MCYMHPCNCWFCDFFHEETEIEKTANVWFMNATSTPSSKISKIKFMEGKEVGMLYFKYFLPDFYSTLASLTSIEWSSVVGIL